MNPNKSRKLEVKIEEKHGGNKQYIADCVPLGQLILNEDEAMDFFPTDEQINSDQDLKGPNDGLRACLRLLRDLWYYPNAQWRLVRLRVLIGLVKDTENHGNTSVSMGMAKGFFDANPNPLTSAVGFLNCGTGGIKYQYYLRISERIFVVFEFKPKDGANPNALEFPGYNPKKPMSFDQVRRLLGQEIVQASKDFANKLKEKDYVLPPCVPIYAFITGPFREFYEKAPPEIKQQLNEFTGRVFVEIALPIIGNNGSYFLPQEAEGTYELTGTQCMYRQLSNDSLLLPGTQVIGSFGIGRGSCQWMIQSGSEVFLCGLNHGMTNPQGLATLSDSVIPQLFSREKLPKFLRSIMSCERPVIALKSGCSLLLENKNFSPIRNALTYVPSDDDLKAANQIGSPVLPGSSNQQALQQALATVGHSNRIVTIHGPKPPSPTFFDGRGMDLPPGYSSPESLLSTLGLGPPTMAPILNRAPSPDAPPAYSWPAPPAYTYTEKELEGKSLADRNMILFSDLRRNLSDMPFIAKFNQEAKKSSDSRPDVKNFPALFAAAWCFFEAVRIFEKYAIENHCLQYIDHAVVTLSSELRFDGYIKNATAAAGVAIDEFARNPTLEYIAFLKGATKEVTCQIFHRHPVKGIVTLADTDLKGVTFSALRVQSYGRDPLDGKHKLMNVYTPRAELGSTTLDRIVDVCVDHLESKVPTFLGGKTIQTLQREGKLHCMFYLGGPIRDAWEIRKCNEVSDRAEISSLEKIPLDFVAHHKMAKYNFTDWKGTKNSYFIGVDDENLEETKAVKHLNENALPGSECVGVFSLGKDFAYVMFSDPSGNALIHKYGSGIESYKLLYNASNPNSEHSLAASMGQFLETGNNFNAISAKIKNTSLPTICLKGGHLLLFKLFPELRTLLLNHKVPSPHD